MYRRFALALIALLLACGAYAAPAAKPRQVECFVMVKEGAQPGQAAIEKAARSLGWSEGKAWIAEISRPRAGVLKAVVCFGRS